jgi:hypothetical protein
MFLSLTSNLQEPIEHFIKDETSSNENQEYSRHVMQLLGTKNHDQKDTVLDRAFGGGYIHAIQAYVKVGGCCLFAAASFGDVEVAKAHCEAIEGLNSPSFALNMLTLNVNGAHIISRALQAGHLEVAQVFFDTLTKTGVAPQEALAHLKKLAAAPKPQLSQEAVEALNQAIAGQTQRL